MSLRLPTLAGAAWAVGAAVLLVWEPPVSLEARVAFAALTAGLLPGWIVLNLLERTGALVPRGLIERTLTCVSLGFSLNLLINLALLLFRCSFAAAFQAFLIVIAALACGLLAFRGAGGTAEGVARGAQARDLLAITVIVLGSVWRISGSPAVNPEELISLRKLAESPGIRLDNLSLVAGQPLPYLFAPFQMLVVGTAKLSHVDIAIVYSMLWGFSSIVALLATVGLIRVVFEEWLTLPAALLLTIAAVGGGPSFYNGLGILAPYPNRYGVASGILLPLVLYSLFQYLRPGRQGKLQAFLLSYLTVETTFVHARETLFLCAVILATGLCLAFAREGGRTAARKLAVVLISTGLILLGYKEANLRLGEHLGGYVATMGQDSRDALTTLIRKDGAVGAFFKSADLPIEHHAKGWTGAPVTWAPGYQRVFVQSWAAEPWRSPGYFRYVLLVMGFVLPLFCLLDRRVLPLALCTALTSFALFMLLGSPRLWVAATVGNPEVLDSQNIVFLLAWCLFVGFVGALTRVFVDRGRPGLFALALVSAAVVASLVARYASVAEPGEAAAVGVAWGAHLLALGAIAYSLRRPLATAAVRSGSVIAPVAATLLGCAFLIPGLAQRKPSAEPQRTLGLTGHLVDDYGRLMKAGLIPRSEIPWTIVEFVRGRIPAHAVVVSEDTLGLITVAPVHAPFVSEGGSVPQQFVDNAGFLNHFAIQPHQYSMADFVGNDENRALFREFLKSSRVSFVIASPSELEALTAARCPPSDLGLELVFSSDGFGVYAASYRGGA